MANNVDPDQTAPIGAVCSWSTLFASFLSSSVMLGNYLQQTTFSDAFSFLSALRVNSFLASGHFCCLLISFANILDPDQDRQNVGPGLDSNHGFCFGLHSICLIWIKLLFFNEK